MTTRARKVAVLGLVVCTLFWAGNTVFARLIHHPQHDSTHHHQLPALVFLGEPIRGYHIAGEVLIFAGFYLAVFAGGRQAEGHQH